MASPQVGSNRRKRIQTWSVVGSLSLVLGACAPSEQPGEAEEETDRVQSALITRVSGASISSPNVDKTKSYLSSRRIGTLDTLGALPGALGSLVRRVDGILGAGGADGRVSVTEIVRMEQPAYIRTLYPDEKAALPGLWALLETTPSAPTSVKIPNLPALPVRDLSKPPTVPIKPPQLAIDSLPASLQPAANRLEMIEDSDGNPGTITEADLSDPLRNPAPWTATEIDAFKQIKLLFVARAGTTLDYVVQVPAPGMTPVTAATLGSAMIVVEQSVRYEEPRSALFLPLDTTNSVTIGLQAQRSAKIRAYLGSATHLVLLDINSEEERIVTDEISWEFSGTAVAEIWNGGTRLGSYRLSLSKIAPESDLVYLDDYVGYRLLAGGRPLIRNLSRADLDETYSYSSYRTTDTFDLTALPPPSSVNYRAVNMLATPKPNLMPGRYEFSVAGLGTGRCKLDISSGGFVFFTRPGDVQQRMVIKTGRKSLFMAPYTDDLQVEFDPASGTVKIGFFGSSLLFDGVITDAERTG